MMFKDGGKQKLSSAALVWGTRTCERSGRRLRWLFCLASPDLVQVRASSKQMVCVCVCGMGFGQGL